MAAALPDDRQQTISIESDSAERNEKTGLTVYSGNVIISQGSILIEAEEITLHYQGSKISRIECTGTPASYQQRPQAEGAMLVARAEHIDYLLASDQIILKRNAVLSRNGTIIKGDSIDYDIKNETWKAKGNDLGEQKRIQLVIPPSVQESTPQETHSLMAILEARNLAKAYGKRPVVKDVSMSVKQGEIVGLLGPNGAGKTTCFYMIIGLVNQDNGTITIDNDDITALPMHGRARRGLGYLPQEPSVFRKLSVEDNILAILETQKDLSRAQRKQRLEELMNEFHISHLAKSPGMSLSGGERRRVEIARALAANPQFILLDEPFAGVDPISVTDIKNIIRHLRDSGIGVLITDHNVRETLDICEHAYIIGEGHVIAEGTTEDILSDANVIKTYLGENFTL